MIPAIDPHLLMTYGGLSGATVYITEGIKLIFGKKIKVTWLYDVISYLVAAILAVGATVLLEPSFNITHILYALVFAIPVTHTGNKVYDYLSNIPFIQNSEKILADPTKTDLSTLDAEQPINQTTDAKGFLNSTAN